MYVAEIEIDEVHFERAAKEERDLLVIVRIDPRTEASVCGLLSCDPMSARAILNAAKSGMLSVLREG